MWCQLSGNRGDQLARLLCALALASSQVLPAGADAQQREPTSPDGQNAAVSVARPSTTAPRTTRAASPKAAGAASTAAAQASKHSSAPLSGASRAGLGADTPPTPGTTAPAQALPAPVSARLAVAAEAVAEQHDTARVELELQAARRELVALAARESRPSASGDPRAQAARLDPTPRTAAAARVPSSKPRPAGGSGYTAARSRSTPLAPDPRNSAGPTANSSTSSARRSGPQHTRLEWLEGLTLPDLPVRWDDRLVRALEYYKNDARGRAIVRGLLVRKGRYANLVRAKLKAAQLPQDLLYLAMVESAFEPRARSAAGAVGLWQLMAAAATSYGLELSAWVDERMHVERATDASLRYLRDLYTDLGSWPLALTAFNMGQGGLLRAMSKYNTNDFWRLANLEAGLPFETVSYVTKVYAFAIIANNPARFGFGDVRPDPPLDPALVALPGGTSLTRIARAAGLTLEQCAALNPELKQGRLPPDVKTWDVRLPRERLAAFRERWASSAANFVPRRSYVLKLGEHPSDVAEMYGTSLAKLLALNDVSEVASIRPGYRLRVPDVEPAARPKLETPTVGVLGDRFVYADRQRVFYRVVDGDELAEVARIFQVTPDEVLMWNRVAHDCKLQRGMYLQLFVPKTADLSQALFLTPDQVRTLVIGTEQFFEYHEAQQERVRIRYRIKPGDTLTSLAERFDLSVGSIARINRFSRDTKLVPNAEIILYAKAKKRGK